MELDRLLLGVLAGALFTFAFLFAMFAPSCFLMEDAPRDVVLVHYLDGDGGTITLSQHWSGGHILVFQGEKDYNATVYLYRYFKEDPESVMASIHDDKAYYNQTPITKSGPIASYLFDLHGGSLRPLVVFEDGTYAAFDMESIVWPSMERG